MTEAHIRVQMFSTFQIDVCGSTVISSEGHSSKNILALQVLLYYYPNKVSRDMLLDILCSEVESTDPSANLRTIFSRLNRLLKKVSLNELFRITGDAHYRWLECSSSIFIDVQEFSRLCDEATQTEDTARRLDLLQQAEQLYRNDFLHFSSPNDWNQSMLAALRKKYLMCVEELTRLLSQEKQWAPLFAIATKACRLYPVEHYYCVAIDCLLAQNQYRQADHLYTRALHVLRDELFVTPSKALLSRADRINRQLVHHHETIFEFQQQLCEAEHLHGPYYCSPSSFLDVFRIVCRMAERLASDTFLLLYSFIDFRGQPIRDVSKIDAASRHLTDSIQNCLRRGDAFTQYRRGQFIVLLTNTSSNGFEVVNKRICRYYYAHSMRGVHLHCIRKTVEPSFFQE